MVNFPSDKVPPEYNQEILTRQIEDIYKNLGGIDDAMINIEALKEQLDILLEQVGTLNQNAYENDLGQYSVMPVPENLTIVKIKGIALYVAYCDPIEIMKYPYVWGYQFFASQEKDFTPLIKAEDVTYEGTHSGINNTMTLSVTSALTKNGQYAFDDFYTNLPFWYDMGLQGGAVCVSNTTDASSGLVTAWNRNFPWQMTTTLGGGTDNDWDTGDGYRMTIRRPRNLIGQGPLPFAVGVLGFNDMLTANPKWDGVSMYVKARTYGMKGPRFGRTSEFAYTSNVTTDDLSLDEAITVNAIPHFYAYYIQVKWNMGHTAPQHYDEFDHYNLYRTTTNDSNLLTNDTYLIADTRNLLYNDDGYDVTDNPTGPEPGTTYYYWIRQVDRNGNIGDNSTPDNAVLAIAANPVIYAGIEDEDRGWGSYKAWRVYWTCAGGAEGYYVRHRLKLNGTYGLWTLPVYIAHTTEFGQTGGEDIQSYSFQNLVAGRTYTFAVKAVQNPLVDSMSSIWVTQDYTIVNTTAPDAPT